MMGYEAQVSQVLNNVATRLVLPINSAAIAYAMHRAPYMFSVLNSLFIYNLKTNIEALTLQTNAQDIAEIGTGYSFDAGFLHNLTSIVGKPPRGSGHATDIAGLGYFDYIQGMQPIKSHQGELNVAWKA
ncbi:hypothetical protein BDV30DRAFT_243483 [Aspergillus minisclerotigenes]|uniref:Uncharacterized protein n=1 Tax=Aspergillus minisclerotigenes TaxID=656917 RepID=A0A5N6IST5_9EURO|nr:hypothetical protein BDV30DRAFT_243483 [Aspergillus minisclerotigenes]